MATAKTDERDAAPTIAESEWKDVIYWWPFLRDYTGQLHFVLDEYVQAAVVDGKRVYRIRDETLSEWENRQW